MNNPCFMVKNNWHWKLRANFRLTLNYFLNTYIMVTTQMFDISDEYLHLEVLCAYNIAVFLFL